MLPISQRARSELNYGMIPEAQSKKGGMFSVQSELYTKDRLLNKSIIAQNKGIDTSQDAPSPRYLQINNDDRHRGSAGGYSPINQPSGYSPMKP
jgi:hypothetical protein